MEGYTETSLWLLGGHSAWQLGAYWGRGYHGQMRLMAPLSRQKNRVSLRDRRGEESAPWGWHLETAGSHPPVSQGVPEPPVTYTPFHSLCPSIRRCHGLGARQPGLLSSSIPCYSVTLGRAPNLYRISLVLVKQN